MSKTFVVPHGDKVSTPFDVFTIEGAHWGQIRLHQLGPSLMLEVKPDTDDDWQDFQSFVVQDGKLMYGVIGRRKQ